MSKAVIRNEKVFLAQMNVRRWGNSHGVRLPKGILSLMNLKENDRIGINVVDGKMIVEKINNPSSLA